MVYVRGEKQGKRAEGSLGPKLYRALSAMVSIWLNCEAVVMIKWDTKKQRHYFADKGPSSQSYGFSSSLVERWSIDAFELWRWKRLLGVPWTARRSNQSILKDISPEYSLEGPMLKLKLQYFGHLMWRADIWKDPDSGQDWRREEKETTEDEMVGWHHQLNKHGFEKVPGDSEGWVCLLA